MAGWWVRKGHARTRLAGAGDPGPTGCPHPAGADPEPRARNGVLMAASREQINPKLTPATKALLMQYCQERHTTQSDVVEAALLAFMQRVWLFCNDTSTPG